MFQSLGVRVEGAVGELRLERPEKLNALSPDTLEEIVRAARHFDAQPGVKIVIVRGAGKSFSSGADLASFGRSEGRTTREVAELGRAMADSLEAMRAITIAAIRGHCVGGGVVPDAELDREVEALARSLSKKASHVLVSTKRHVDAVTGQMVGSMRSWSDADGLVAAFADEECAAARRDYLRSRKRPD